MYKIQPSFRTLERELTIRGFSRKTIKSYLHINKKFIEYIKKSPREVTKDDIKNYLEFFKTTRGVSNKTMNKTIAALKFYYTGVYGRRMFHGIKYCKNEQRLPTVLTKEEIKGMIEATINTKHKLLIKFVYSTGVRVSELVRIKTEDVDLDKKIVHIRQGKGKKDRISILSNNLVEELKIYLSSRKDLNRYLFPGARKVYHLSTRSAQKIVKKAAKIAGIKKGVSCHTLRHSFATHLFENGVDIRYIQKLLGHKRLDTTQVYTRVSTQQLEGIENPLDYL